MDDIRNFILDKAQERFERFGYKKTTMDEISRDCRVSKKTIYEHFTDKENLFDCLFARESRKALEIIFARMGEVLDPVDRLVRLLRTSIEYFNEDNFLTRLLKDDYTLFSAFLTSRSRAMLEDELIAIIAGIINEGKLAGSIRDVDEEVIAYAGLKLFQAFSYLRTTNFVAEKEAQGYYTDVLADFVVTALVKK